MCVCVCVCVRERERERERERAMYVCMCERAVHLVCCMCEGEREREQRGYTDVSALILARYSNVFLSDTLRESKSSLKDTPPNPIIDCSK